MKRKFYYEYDEVEKTWDVMEVDGGSEQGQYYDVLLFCTPTEEDAQDAVEVLMELSNGI